jgi:prolyl oligopeptidase
MAFSAAWLAAVVLRAGTAQAVPPVPSIEWADIKRTEALDAIPEGLKIETEVIDLFRAGWNPFYHFDPVSIDHNEVEAFDPSTRSWRRASLPSYVAGTPDWKVMFSAAKLDTPGRSFRPRPWRNISCENGFSSRCMVAVSTGSFDVVRWVELDGATGAIAKRSFDVPADRTDVAWLNDSALLVASPAAGGSKSASGYPTSVRLLERGTPLYAAKVLFQAPDPVDAVFVSSLGNGGRRIGLIRLTQGLVPVGTLLILPTGQVIDPKLPRDSSIDGLVAGRLIIKVLADTVYAERSWKAGSAFSVAIRPLVHGQASAAEPIFLANSDRTLETSPSSSTVLTTKRSTYLAALEGGVRQLYRASFESGHWRTDALSQKAGEVGTLIAADANGDAALITIESLIAPPRMQLLRVKISRSGTQSPQLFDASQLTIDRFIAKADDGTGIPYWIVRPSTARGPLPTILHAYGAGNQATLPNYAGEVGKLWLEKGGSYVIAQVRGGGEYGPKWGAAGQGTRRDVPVNDLIAVAKDMIARKFTDAGRLGLEGFSDGGRLVAGAAVLRPDLFAAAVSRDGPLMPEVGAVEGSPLIAADRRLLESASGRALADKYWPDRIFARRRACPNILLTSWRGDRRVSAEQTRAFAAELGAGGCAPLLFEQPGGEHGYVTSALLGVVYGFLSERLGLSGVGSTDPDIVYSGASVWSGQTFKLRNLAVRNGRFINPEFADPDARRIDLGGRFIVPPYGNAHTHITPPNRQISDAALKAGVYYLWNPNTSVITHEGLSFFRRSDTYDVRVAQGGITEPGGHPERLYVSELGPTVYPDLKPADMLGNMFHYGRTTQEIDTALDHLVAQHADFVKIYLLHSEYYDARKADPRFIGRHGLNPVHVQAIVEAARRRGLLVAAHVETAFDLRVAAEAGVAVAEHLPGYGPVVSATDYRAVTLTPSDAALIRRKGMLVVPTFGIAAGAFGGSPRKTLQTADAQARTYSVQRENLRLLLDAGVTVLAGTDAGPSIFKEVEHWVTRTGLSPQDALTIALGTGSHLFPEPKIGCFESGCEADFLVLKRDPMKDISALRSIESGTKAGHTLW